MSTLTPNFNIPVPTPTTLFKDLGAELLTFGTAIDAILASFDYNGADPNQVLTRVAALESWRTSATAQLAALDAANAYRRGTKAQREATTPLPGMMWKDTDNNGRLWSVSPTNQWRRHEGVVTVASGTFSASAPVYYASPSLTIPTVISADEAIEIWVSAANASAFLTVNTSGEPTRNTANTVVTARLTRLAATGSLDVTFGWRVVSAVA